MTDSPAGSPDETQPPQPGQTWQRVEKPSTPADAGAATGAPEGTDATAPRDGAPAAPAGGDVPPIPTWAKVLAAAALLVLLLLAAWIGASLGANVGPDEPELPGWELAPPQTIGDLVRGEVTETSPSVEGDLRVVRTDYSDGTDRLVLILSRPQTDLNQLLTDSLVEDVSSVGQARCGTSADTGTPVCTEIVDNTSLMVVGLTEQTPEDLAALLVEFQESLVP